MSEVFVIGHRNPDTDAICSAIGYAEFKRRTGMPEAVAARCGDTNDRIDFVLKTFGVPSPRFVADVSPKVRDVMQAEVFSVKPDATAADALGLMDEHDIRVLPVLDADRRCRGLLSLFKLSKFLFPAANRLMDSRRVLSSLENLAQTLGGQLLLGHDTQREEELILMISAMAIETFAQRLEHYPLDKLAVVIGRPHERPGGRDPQRCPRVDRDGRPAGGSKNHRSRQTKPRQHHHLAARHVDHGVALPFGRGHPPHDQRGISFLPRRLAVERRPGRGGGLRLRRVSRHG